MDAARHLLGDGAAEEVEWCGSGVERGLPAILRASAAAPKPKRNGRGMRTCKHT